MSSMRLFSPAARMRLARPLGAMVTTELTEVPTVAKPINWKVIGLVAAGAAAIGFVVLKKKPPAAAAPAAKPAAPPAPPAPPAAAKPAAPATKASERAHPISAIVVGRLRVGCGPIRTEIKNARRLGVPLEDIDATVLWSDGTREDTDLARAGKLLCAGLGMKERKPKVGRLDGYAQAGFDAPPGAQNPSIATSEAAYAWNLGRFLATTGRSRPNDVRMGRGYTIWANNMLFNADTMERLK